jgi:hypothetical protein
MTPRNERLTAAEVRSELEKRTGADMKDAFCLAVLTAKVLCLVMFVTMLRPDHINPVQAASAAQYCKAGHTAAQACDLGVDAR